MEICSGKRFKVYNYLKEIYFGDFIWILTNTTLNTFYYLFYIDNCAAKFQGLFSNKFCLLCFLQLTFSQNRRNVAYGGSSEFFFLS